MNNHIYIHSLFPATYKSVGYLPAAAPSPCCSYYKRQELQRTQGKGSQLPRQSSSQAGAGQLLASSRQAFCQPRPIEEDAVTAQKLPNFLQLRYLRRREGRGEKEEEEARQRSSQADHGVAVAAGRQLLPTGNWLRKRIRKRGGGLPAPPCLAGSLPACLPGVRAKTELVFPKWTEAAAPLRSCCLLPLCTVTH